MLSNGAFVIHIMITQSSLEIKVTKQYIIIQEQFPRELRERN